MAIPSPMKLQWFHILLALSEGSLHGYGIQRAVLDRTEGKLRLWPATLYRLLGALEEEGYIQATEGPEDEPEDQRRQYYALTRAGRTRLEHEAAMLADWARAAGAGGEGWEGGPADVRVSQQAACDSPPSLSEGFPPGQKPGGGGPVQGDVEGDKTSWDIRRLRVQAPHDGGSSLECSGRLAE